MPGPKPSSLHPSTTTTPPDSKTRRVEWQSHPSAEQLQRLAEMVARGEAPIPEDLEPIDLQKLLAELACRRRTRLIRFIAQAIAEDIHRSRTH